MRALVRLLLTLALAPGLSVAGPERLRAQTEASLERVEELTRLGRTEEARELLLDWWERGRAQASRRDRQRGLWLRGRLTVDPTQAELDYRRLVIEYPGGAFSDRALLRLAQGAWARGDVEGTDRTLTQLARDYPGSSVAREARRWRSEAGPAPESPVASGPTAPTTSGEPPDAGAERPGASPVAQRPTQPTSAGAPGQVTIPAGSFAVQLGAFAGEGRARALRDRVAAAGYQARLVRVEGSRLLHVRVGRFTEVEGAEALLEEIRGLGLTAALVRDAHNEEGVSR